MASVENIAPINADSEMEEGEIVDDLSDISSEEEYLLRERLAVLENYNNVLERKKAKRSYIGSGTKRKKDDAISYDLSEISATEFEDYCSSFKNAKVQKPKKTHHRQKRKRDEKNDLYQKSKEYKKKNSRTKKKVDAQGLSDSSEESGEDLKNQRKKLAEAVVVNKINNDKTSLSERLQKMLCGVNPEPIKFVITENDTDTHIDCKTEVIPINSVSLQNTDDNNVVHLKIHDTLQESKNSIDVIDISSDVENKTIVTLSSINTADSGLLINHDHKNDQNNHDITKNSDKDSDDDLELLRQHALKTKTTNPKKKQVAVPLSSENKNLSEDEDSDTTELRLICLKSAIIKKAIEMKRKQKLQKRLSQSSNIQDDSLENVILGEKMNSDNNTDIESVDMDIGSDGEDKIKENGADCVKNTLNDNGMEVDEKHIPVLMVTKEDELEEDEDLLRAKLLTSLSKNLPNLVTPSVNKTTEPVVDTASVMSKQPQSNALAEEKRFIINVGSDSEEENEATMNLTKMHIKLSDQKDFQQKLDMFLKSTRMEIENTTLPDVVQQPVAPAAQLPKKNEKYVAKAVKNLPKSEQLEYKYLVKRMAELEKIKQARQSTIGLGKDVSKPKNTTINNSHLSVINNLEEKIKMSRKTIAEESAKMLKLKEEGIKLSQKFKIVATELRNIKTALTLNKKQQRSVQNFLTKIRQHHHMLLKSSLTSTHSKVNVIQHLNKLDSSLKSQNLSKQHTNMLLKETTKENKITPITPKSGKIDVIKNLKETNKPLVIQNEVNLKPLVKQIESIETKANKILVIQKEVNVNKAEALQHSRLSVEVDIVNNKKVVIMSNKDDDKGYENASESSFENQRHSSHPVVEKGGGSISNGNPQRRNSDDYRSPLDAFGSTTWRGDPNAILCPFEVCGDCKDADCKYLHTNTPSK